MATVIELGQKVKAKYPAYAGMDDAEVGRKVKAKYPGSYDSFTDVPSKQAPEAPASPASFDQAHPVASFVPNLIIGGVKGLLDLPRQAAELGNKLGKFAAEKTMGKTVDTTQGAASALQQSVKPVASFQPVGGVQKAGFDTAPYLLPTGLEEAGAKVASKILPNAPKLGKAALKVGGKMLGSAADFGAKTAVHTQDLGATAAATAGGAALSGVTQLGGAIIKPIISHFNPDMEAAFIRGVGPTSGKAEKFAASAKTALPDLHQSAKELGKDISVSANPIQDILDSAKAAKQRVWSEYKNLMGGYGKFEIDGNKIADSMISSMDERFIKQNPTEAANIIKKAKTYRRPLTLNEAENYLEGANGELQTYYAKNKLGRLAAVRDPSVSHVVKEADALRSQLYSKLDEATGQGGGAASLKRRYGALSDVQEQVLKRQAKLAITNPNTLAEQINYPMAAAKGIYSAARGDLIGGIESLTQAGVTKAMKEATTSENLLRKAFGAAEKNGLRPHAPILPPKPMTSNLLGPGNTIYGEAPAATSDTSRLLSQNEANTNYSSVRKNTVARAKSTANLTGNKLTSGGFSMEDVSLIKNADGSFYVKRSGYPKTRISQQEAYMLQRAGYEAKEL